MNLRENEELVKIVRSHKSNLNGALSLSGALVFLFFFVFLYFKFNFFGYEWQVLSLVVLLSVAIVLYKLYVWKKDALYITNQRVIRNEQSGLFSKTVTEILFRDIHEIIFNKKGFSSVINNYGNLIIRTPSDSEIVFKKISDPEKVVEIINKTRMASHKPNEPNQF
ncbi:MAG: PH domain-containing protein [Candidatus Paceibacterota bacterium]